MNKARTTKNQCYLAPLPLSRRPAKDENGAGCPLFGTLGVCAYVECQTKGKQNPKTPSMGVLGLDS